MTALVIPTFENNIGFKLAALNTYLKHKPDNVDVYFVYGGRSNQIIRNQSNDHIRYFDAYVETPDRITLLHRKLYKFFRVFKNKLKKYSHIIKIDDDTFISNIDTINLDKLTGDYCGNVVKITDKNEQQLRNKLLYLKHYKVRETYTGSLPEQYCSGECYILSQKALQKLISYKGTKKRVNFGLEDIFTGYMLNSQGINSTQCSLIKYEHPVQMEKFNKFYSDFY